METLWLFCVVTAVCFQFVPIIGDSSHNVKPVAKDVIKPACLACERLPTQSQHNQEKDRINKKQPLRPAQKTASASSTDRAPDGSPNSNRDSSGVRQTQSPHNQEKDLVKKKQRLRPQQKTESVNSKPTVDASVASPSNSNSVSSGEHHSQHSGQQGVQNTMVSTCSGPGLGAGCEGMTQGAGASSNPPPPQNDSDLFVPILHENPSSDNSPCISDEDEKEIDDMNGPLLELCFDLENSKSTTICEDLSSVSSLDMEKEDVVDFM